ncbi:calcium-dependent protein kinase, putative [Babesia caballi]|uniref:Calcium-dependent protein kinase, putative n=1 Tax=Babesia caballi TaxID=5871 RepID=A0AAV4LUZ0_BABCB|nr:calcium-dependent protein kinase, putative [Babesia caballi]
MGNCCAQGGVFASQRNTTPRRRGCCSRRARKRPSLRGDDAAYVAPDICDVFYKGLRRPVCVPNAADDSSSAAAANDASSTRISSSSERNQTEDHAGVEAIQRADLGSSRSSVGREGDWLIRKLSDHPRVEDLVLMRDFWRSRIVTNRRITDRYSVTANSIGCGVGGSVRQVVDRMSQRAFALKSLRTRALSRRKLMGAFNEIAIFTQLDHPNIAFLHEAYDSPGVCHLVMEHCSGGELYDRLDNYKRFSESYAKRLTVQMLLAVNYLHANGICHRDLKLENWVFATPDTGSLLKMIDFGFARLFEDGVPMGKMHGTVYYVDPEVIDGCYNEKCDVWSTGVIVYMLLSGSPPFNGEGDKEILWKIKKGMLKFEGTRWSRVSGEAKDFIAYLLNRDGRWRASAYEALHHNWLREEVLKFGATVVKPEALRHMVEFSKRPPLHRALVALCVFEAERNVNREVYSLFFAINTSLSGSISLAEFTDALVRHLALEEREAAVVFDALAFRGSAMLTYTEFVAAVYEHYETIDAVLISQMYARLESLGNGRVDMDALTACFGERFNGDPLVAIAKDAGLAEDGVIGFNELRDCLVSVP